MLRDQGHLPRKFTSGSPGELPLGAGRSPAAPWEGGAARRPEPRGGWLRGCGPPKDITAYDKEEFTALGWLTHAQVLTQPRHSMGPYMHRFTRKLARALGS